MLGIELTEIGHTGVALQSNPGLHRLCFQKLSGL